MAIVEYFVPYTIFFSDPTEYAYAISVASGTNWLKMCPRDAATMFGIPYPYPTGDMDSVSKGIKFIAPNVPGFNIPYPNPSGILLDDTKLSTDVPAQPGTQFGSPRDGRITWAGDITKSKGNNITNNPPPVANSISQRRWLGGRELSHQFEGTGAPTTNACRDFSRTIDGVGWGMRGNSLTGSWTRTVNEFRAITPRTSWERFYIRVRRNPASVNQGFWKCQGTASAFIGTKLRLDATGIVNIYDVDNVGGENFKSAFFTPTINQWYRIDIFLRYGDGGAGCTYAFYLNGTLVYKYSGGSTSASTHTSSTMGKLDSTDAEVEIDFDDWINADIPANLNATTLDFSDTNYPIDWLLGSHVRAHYTKSASQTGWSPTGAAVGILNQDPHPATILGTSELTSSTSGATLEGLTDAPAQNAPDQIFNVLGAASAIVSTYSKNTAGTDGQLGYRIAGAAATLATVDQTIGAGIQKVAYLPSAVAVPAEIAPWSVVHTKSADANTDTTYMMMTSVEYLGVWGPEDDPAFNPSVSRLSFTHNSRFCNSQWGYVGNSPEAPTCAIGGTYVGNGTYQEISLPVPCHFLIIRAVSGGTYGIRYFGSSYGAHQGYTQQIAPNVRIWFDATAGVCKFSVAGAASSECNVSGTTYQYIAFCDPGMRFNLCGAFSHGNSSSTPKANALCDSSWLATAGFAQLDLIAASSTNSGLYFRGPGNTANGGCDLNAALLTNFGNFAAGIFNSYADIHWTGGPINYSLWRTTDACGNVGVQILSYTGNGTNPRTISLTPTSSRYPLFVLVVPVAASASYFRDPSHTGSNSSNVTTVSANSTTAITAVGLDSITVQSSLNANGVVYNVFAICGDSAGMNNGTFYTAYCNGQGPYAALPAVSTDPNVMGNGGLLLGTTIPLTLLKDVSGIYTITKGQRHDVLIDRQTGQTSVSVEIPDPMFKTGYIGG